MTLMEKNKDLIISFLEEHYTDAKTSLNFSNPFECLVAISLSAQTTDKSVNLVTPNLFKNFPTPFEMAKASLEEVEELIHSIGLYHNKAKNIISLSKELVSKYNGIVPNKKEDLVKLPGVGNKTAGVFLLEMGTEPAIPVDTHIKRISNRLGYSKKNDTPEKIEKKLEKTFPKDKWVFLHHALIWFGRDTCKAINPLCENCKLHEVCLYFKKNSSTTAK